MIFKKKGRYTQAMTKEEEAELKRLLNQMGGARLSIGRRDHDVAVDVEAKRAVEEDAGDSGSQGRRGEENGDWMEVDDVSIGKEYFGLLTIEEDQEFECQHCGIALCFCQAVNGNHVRS